MRARAHWPRIAIRQPAKDPVTSSSQMFTQNATMIPVRRGGGHVSEWTAADWKTGDQGCNSSWRESWSAERVRVILPGTAHL